ncbi:ATP-binding domain-containing protein [uncultured Polaribacter sp.]|uniref:DEAD/DEAH box helicase n=1 Tax=uncultured Polaribacter sp. TaxID=174711 RepID=UPI0026365D36|nr:ATP-binding domain-containing protein [uncultured Polaribacter sp.]
MEQSLFYSHIKENDLNKNIIESIRKYTNKKNDRQVYLLDSPLGEKYEYEYSENAIVLLSPKHKIIFLNLKDDNDDFETFYEDFIEDLSYISDKYNYKDFIGRPREWKKNITVKENYNREISISELLKQNELDSDKYRVGELLISLLTGSINDIAKIGAEEPSSILERVKQNIILFDGDQTRFIYKKFTNKTVSIQGLSGTGKTELLLHKLKELYVTEEKAKIFFTCHNIALANTLRSRIPSFFNFMKVEKQIEWNSKLWVNRAWGSRRDINSGLYSYLCDFYNIPFLRYSSSTNYSKIFSQALEHINKIDESNFKYAFDYILIDERQDFPNVFFELCEKVASKKVYIAGDIFQDIFENTKETELEVDIILNRCYRTDPRTLMFAHSIGLGLFEEKKLNWFEDSYWNALGYKMNKSQNNEIELSREPIRRFEDLNTEDFKSTIIQDSTKITNVINILKDIKKTHPTVKPEDVGIIILDDNSKIYDYIDKLSYAISNKLNWKVNRGVETKEKTNDALYITNPNNVKGLEFPFVICITYSIKNTYRYRNILYTMLTRSFIQSYLLVQKEEDGLNILKEGLKTINKENKIKTKEPTEIEKEEINNTLVRLQNKRNISYKEFLTEIFDELEIVYEFRKKIEKAITQTDIEQFDKDQTVRFINANKEFYSK